MLVFDYTKEANAPKGYDIDISTEPSNPTHGIKLTV